MVLTQQSLFFDLKELDIEVSIPLWFLRNKAFRFLLKLAYFVSIPLWFLRNAG